MSGSVWLDYPSSVLKRKILFGDKSLYAINILVNNLYNNNNSLIYATYYSEHFIFSQCSPHNKP